MVSIKHNFGRHSIPRRLTLNSDKRHKSSQQTQASSGAHQASIPPPVSFLHKDKEALRERQSNSYRSQEPSYNQDSNTVLVTQSVRSSYGTTTTRTWVRLRYPLFTFFPPRTPPTNTTIHSSESKAILMTGEFNGNATKHNGFTSQFVHYSFSNLLLFTNLREMNVAALREAADSIWNYDRPRSYKDILIN